MAYRTKTYLAGNWTSDSDAIEQIYRWNEGGKWNLHFQDAHKNKNCYDSSMPCTIKSSLSFRMSATKTFVLVVGNDTASTRKGSCFYYDCGNKIKDIWTGLTSCRVLGKTYSTESFIDYECRLAYRGWLSNEIRIVVLYNAASVNKSKCPEKLRGIGTHMEMKSYNPLLQKYSYDYQKVRKAIEGK